MTTYSMASIGLDGALWAVDSSNTALRFLGDGARQPEPSQSLVSVAVVNAATIYGLDATGNLWQLSDTPMTAPVWNSPNLWKASVAPDGGVWAIMDGNPGGGIVEWANGDWQPRPNGGFYILFLAVGKGNVVWSIDNQSGWWGGPGPALRWNGTDFELVAGAPQDTQWISIAPDDGTVYLQTRSNTTVRYQNGTFTTIATNTPQFYSIAAGPGGALYGNRMGRGEIWTLVGGNWWYAGMNTPSGPSFSAASDGTLCTNAARLAGYNVWTPVAGISQGLDVSAIDAHQMYFETLYNGYMQWGGSQWKQLATGTMRSISAAADGTLWGVDQANNVQAWNGSSWVQQSGTMQKVAVGSAQSIVGLDTNGKLFFMNDGAWSPIASPASGALVDAGIGSDATLALIDSANTLWVRIPPGDWVHRTDVQLTQLDIGDRYHITGVTPVSGNANRVWQGSGRALHPRMFPGGE